MPDRSLIPEGSRRPAGRGLLVLAGVLLAAGAAATPDGSPAVSPPEDRRLQDDRDQQGDLGFPSRGSGRVAESQQDLSPSTADRIRGPPAPAANEAVSRDADGRVTIRAFRL
ncbi:MAG: hypothetical protein OXC11_10240, partial [Rhodospirillales bacterium]|nr:hypothetical protein [Rhodospirillales bacterium]